MYLSKTTFLVISKSVSVCAATNCGINPSCVARLHIKQTTDATVYCSVTTPPYEKLVTQVTSQGGVCVCVCVANLREYTDLIKLTLFFVFFYRKIWDTKVSDPSTR